MIIKDIKVEGIKQYHFTIFSLFILQLIETFQSAMQFCDPDISESCHELFEHLSSLEMQHVANQFDEFKQLSFEIQVGSLKSSPSVLYHNLN